MQVEIEPENTHIRPSSLALVEFLQTQRTALETWAGRPITDAEMAGHLGIGRTTLLKLMEGEPCSVFVLSSIVRAFGPTSAPAVLELLKNWPEKRERKPVC